MTCDLEALTAYVDGEAPAAVAARLRWHLGLCPSCASRIASVRELRAHLAAIPWPEPPAELASQVRALLHQAGLAQGGEPAGWA
jgi:anti-sigma factor RsiW